MKYQQLTAAGRGAIEVLLLEQYTVTQIANKLGVHKSTVSREIAHRGTPSGYDASIAQSHYERLRSSCRKKRKLLDSQRQKELCRKLESGWSPEQIAGRWKRQRSGLYVCTETIYQFLYTDAWAKEEGLFQYLRYGRKKRKKQTGRSVHRLKIPNRVSIHDRPVVVSERIEYGHCEGDSVIYPNKYAINTINELLTGRVVFTKLPRKTAESTADAVIHSIGTLKAKSVTVDNGTEFMNHEHITKRTGVPIFFADTYCSNQRGANENVNMLLRGYLPKRTDISNLTQEELNDIATELNNRPRKRLHYQTPNEVYYQLLHLEGDLTVAVGVRI
jgi:transposase, IS30 family